MSTLIHTPRTDHLHSSRPNDDIRAELIRFIPGGHELVKGEVVAVNKRKYVLRLASGRRVTYNRKEWFEVIE